MQVGRKEVHKACAEPYGHNWDLIHGCKSCSDQGSHENKGQEDQLQRSFHHLQCLAYKAHRKLAFMQIP